MSSVTSGRPSRRTRSSIEIQTTSPNTTVSRPPNSFVPTSRHSRATGDSATRGGVTFVLASRVSPMASYSLTSAG